MVHEQAFPYYNPTFPFPIDRASHICYICGDGLKWSSLCVESWEPSPAFSNMKYNNAAVEVRFYEMCV